jgi:23S rRNA (pseudouridine1915-N3)-methyltransferase
MRLRVLAIGTRMPSWVDTAFQDYWRRMRATWKLELIELPTASRRESGGVTQSAKDAEARRLLPLLSSRDFVVALDEHGTQKSTLALSQWLEQRRGAGQDLVFIIGGPDGLATEVLGRAQWCWSLTALTLPHGLVRVMLAEQLYRASSVIAGHPYHRE